MGRRPPVSSSLAAKSNAHKDPYGHVQEDPYGGTTGREVVSTRKDPLGIGVVGPDDNELQERLKKLQAHIPAGARSSADAAAKRPVRSDVARSRSRSRHRPR